MRKLWTLGTLVLGWSCGVAWGSPDRFSHIAHGIGVEGPSPLCRDGADNDGDGKADDHDRECRKRMPDCAGCHDLRGPDWQQRGRMGHAACNGCHPISQMVGGGRAPALCTSCHLTGNTFRFPPHVPGAEGEFTLARFDHGDHTRDGNRGCTQCHRLSAAATAQVVKDPSPEMGRIGHETCGQSICHGEAVKPAMGDCTGCHVRREGDQPPAAPEWDPYRTAYAFSHVGHARKAGEGNCGDCHVNVAGGGPGARVPLPPMKACESCHQGQVAFSTFGPQCQWCHVHPEARLAK